MQICFTYCYLRPVAEAGQVERQPAQATAGDKNLRPHVLTDRQPLLDLLADPAVGLRPLRQTLLGPVPDRVFEHIPAPIPPSLS